MQASDSSLSHASGRCNARTRDGDPCKNWAMQNGRCRMHGGKSTGRPVVHGRYSVKHRAKLAEKYRAFLEDPEPGNLLNELAMMRALFQDYLSRFDDGVPLPADDIERLYAMLDTIGKLVERISRILNSTALTAAEVQYLQARLADLITQYVEVDKRERFLDELQRVVEVRRFSS